jgi:hypothetical protein
MDTGFPLKLNPLASCRRPDEDKGLKNISKSPEAFFLLVVNER